MCKAFDPEVPADFLHGWVCAVLQSFPLLPSCELIAVSSLWENALCRYCGKKLIAIPPPFDVSLARVAKMTIVYSGC
jgi:hypothetical protein